MCPRGARLLAGHGGLLDTTKIVAHCLLIEVGGELVLVDTGFGLGDCANPKRLGQPFRSLVSPACEERESAIRQVEALGHDPADVRHIVTTAPQPRRTATRSPSSARTTHRCWRPPSGSRR
jgi:glyoxylase-like metal-dependent hydrolase (beta-lactamase superfamily II)